MKHKFFKSMSAAAVSAVVAAVSCTIPFTGSTNARAEGDKNYSEALALSLYMFDANACGTDVDDGPLTWRGNCHTYDSKAALSEAVDFDSSNTSIVDPDGDGYVDVAGGFHDAGDHVKFNLTMGFAASSLAMAEYLNPGAYEKANCRDHLIYELKRFSDYLMKTTFLDSNGEVATICFTVSNESDHSYWQSPEVQDYNRPTYWLTKSKNNSTVCGEMAAGLAGTAYIVKDTNPEYAEKCLTYANAIYNFGKNYSGNNCDGMGGMYSTSSDADDELSLAQTWLWINDKAAKPTLTPSGGGKYSNNQYDCYKYTWDKVYQGYSAMMYKATGDSTFSSELQFELNNAGGLSTSSYANNAGWGNSRYNCALQLDALALANGDASSNYAQAAKYQMNHILGDNSYGYSFLIGFGDKWPTKIHHRAANPGNGGGANANTDAKYTCYGYLVGGDDSSGYQDNQNSYQYTEGALDYNGCFAIACAGLVNLYGGDATAINSVTTASEFKQDYKFDIGGDSPTPIITTTTTTETTTTTTTTTTAPESTTTSETTTTTEEPTEKIKGDYNSDKKVDVRDLALLKSKYNNTADLNSLSDRYDYNGDGQLNNNDIIALQNFILKK